MKKLSVNAAAELYNGRSRACDKCPLARNHKMPSEVVCYICEKAFVEGFRKGVNGVGVMFK